MGEENCRKNPFPKKRGGDRGCTREESLLTCQERRSGGDAQNHGGGDLRRLKPRRKKKGGGGISRTCLGSRTRVNEIGRLVANWVSSGEKKRREGSEKGAPNLGSGERYKKFNWTERKGH